MTPIEEIEARWVEAKALFSTESKPDKRKAVAKLKGVLNLIETLRATVDGQLR